MGKGKREPFDPLRPVNIGKKDTLIYRRLMKTVIDDQGYVKVNVYGFKSLRKAMDIFDDLAKSYPSLTFDITYSMEVVQFEDGARPVITGLGVMNKNGIPFAKDEKAKAKK